MVNQITKYRLTNEKCCVQEPSCCGDYTISKIRDIQYSIGYTISNLSERWLNNLKYGYKLKEADHIIGRLRLYYDALDRAKEQLAYAGEENICLCCERLRKIHDQALFYIRKICNNIPITPIQKDSSNRAKWIQENPYCVSRESWEELAYKVCDTITLTITTEKVADTACDLTYELKVGKIDCETLAAISLYRKACELGVEVSITKQECALEYKLLVEKYKCDLTLDMYTSLIDCKLTPKMISTIYDCGLSLRISSSKSDCPILVTSINAYPLCQLDFEELFTETNCYKLAREIGFDPSMCAGLQKTYRSLYSAYSDNIALNLKINNDGC